MPSTIRERGIKSFPRVVQDIIPPAGDCPAPLRYTIDVGWGDCDPAQIAYTGRIPEWGLRAIENWYRQWLGADWYDINLKQGLGTPFVALDCQFTRPITPESKLDTITYVTRLGEKSVSHKVTGFQDQELCFTLNTTAAFVDARSMSSVSIPSQARQRIQQYIDCQDGPPGA